MSASKIKISFLFFDFLFEQFNLEVNRRTYFLKNIFSNWDIIKEQTGHDYRTKEMNYFVFRDWIEDYSLELRSYHKEYLFKKDKENSFHCKELLFKVIKQNFNQTELDALYTKTLDICLLDLNPYPWKIEILNEVENSFNINTVQANKIRKDKVVKCLNLKVEALTMDNTQKYYILFLCSQLMFQSDGHLDRSESIFLRDMFAKLGIDLPEWKNLENIITSGAFVGFNSKSKDFTEKEKNKLVSVMSLIVMGDGVLAEKEILSLRHYFEKYHLSFDELSERSENLRCSIDQALDGFSNLQLSLIFNICLDLSLSDGELHKREIQILTRIYERIEFSSQFEKHQFDTTTIHTCLKSEATQREYHVIFDTIIKDNSRDLSKINSILCELHLFYKYFSPNQYEDEIITMAEYFFEDWDFHEYMIQFAKISEGEIIPEHMVFYVKLICMTLDGKCSPIIHEKVSEGINSLIMALKPNDLSDSALYYVIQAALFDGVLDQGEDQSIIQFMLHFGVSEARVNKVLQLHSIEKGKEFQLSRFYQQTAM
jgi:hypothetical protein